MDFFHLELTGEVGGYEFDTKKVKKLLAQYPGKHVDVLVDSFGGSLPVGLSICGAIRDHGDVTVHYRGMSASAATIVSMGAKRVCIAPEAMYLVHKASMEFFDWAQRNADELEDFIKALQSQKDDLDTIDRTIAELYAARCKKPVKDLLELMKNERWLTAKEALDWGFVDEITGAEPLEKPKLTKAQASACRALGHPLPPLEMESESRSFIRMAKEAVLDIINSIKSDINMCNNVNGGRSAQNNGGENPQSQQGAVGQQGIAGQQGAVSPQGAGGSQNVAGQQGSCGQQGAGSGQQNTSNSGDGQGSAQGDGAAGCQNSAMNAESFQARIRELEEENARLRNSTPGAQTGNVVGQHSAAGEQKKVDNSQFAKFARTSASARKLFDAVP